MRRQPTSTAIASIPSLVSLLLLLAGCQSQVPTLQEPDEPSEAAIAPDSAAKSSAEGPFAEVTAVTVTGDPGAYTFNVTVQSPDTGCDQYADWWEVLTEDGNLVYRRILAHSHVDEQPFERSGGPVDIEPNQTVIVRAHMSSAGYGPQALEGAPVADFEARTLPDDFAAALAEAEPQPGDCAF